MFELLGIVALLVVGGVLVGLLALLGWVAKLLFKIVLFPFWLSWTILKVVLVGVAFIVALSIVVPIVVSLGIIGVAALILLGGLLWGGMALVTG